MHITKVITSRDEALVSLLEIMRQQPIAEENNLSETAFFVRAGNAFELRWFTPANEVDLCGHTTLASAHVLFEHLGFSGPEMHFQTRSSCLILAKSLRGLRMNVPAAVPKVCEALPALLLAGLGKAPREVLAALTIL
jgi:predicted PhzF superfamily epimerase YddE/YHI9